MDVPTEAPSPAELTLFLVDLSRGRGEPDSALMRYVYDQLRITALAYARGPRARSVQPTELVHETFLKLFDRAPIEWNNRLHFFALAARAMRQILVDHARVKQRRQETEGVDTVELRELSETRSALNVDLLDLDEALRELAELDERESHVVELRYFGGLSITDVARVLGVSHATVERDWATARAWLHRRLMGSREK